MFELLITMIERLGIIVTIAFVLTRFRFFREMINKEQLNTQQQYKAIVFFGFFGIIGTYSGMALDTATQEFDRWAAGLTADEAIANSRVVGVVLAGLLGGYKVGIGAGILAGLHRFTLGGFTALACGLAAMAAGIIAGFFHKKDRHAKLSASFFIGAFAETTQMVIILIMAKPFDKAVTLVEIIGLPMILANGIGSALFLLIIKNVISEEEKAGAAQAQRALRIADQTLAFLRKGMNTKSADAVCNILHREIQSSAVAITSTSEILAHVGIGDDHHKANSSIQTQITRDVIQNGQLVIAKDDTIHCRNKDCPLGAAVIAPLKQRGETIGTLKFYFGSEKEITNLSIELITGLGLLLSNQLEIAQAEKAYQLAQEAEIKALQAQISPHFLFNTLNTIISLTRIDPDKARMLLVSLSHFLRQNLTATTVSLTTLEQEMRHTKAYLAIEETRFFNKLTVEYDIDEEALLERIPPLTLQPIVENAIKHGIKDKEDNCVITVSIKKNRSTVIVSVTDNGNGIPEERIKELGVKQVHSSSGSGLALFNVNRRLTMMFGEQSSLHIQSKIDKGTNIHFILNSMEE